LRLQVSHTHPKQTGRDQTRPLKKRAEQTYFKKTAALFSKEPSQIPPNKQLKKSETKHTAKAKAGAWAALKRRRLLRIRCLRCLQVLHGLRGRRWAHLRAYVHVPLFPCSVPPVFGFDFSCCCQWFAHASCGRSPCRCVRLASAFSLFALRFARGAARAGRDIPMGSKAPEKREGGIAAESQKQLLVCAPPMQQH
jgi:hypothetical protein